MTLDPMNVTKHVLPFILYHFINIVVFVFSPFANILVSFSLLTETLFFSASVPVFISPPANQTALDGKDATLTCHAEGAPAPNVTWYFNGK